MSSGNHGLFTKPEIYLSEGPKPHSGAANAAERPEVQAAPWIQATVLETPEKPPYLCLQRGISATRNPDKRQDLFNYVQYCMYNHVHQNVPLGTLLTKCRNAPAGTLLPSPAQQQASKCLSYNEMARSGGRASVSFAQRSSPARCAANFNTF